MTPQEVSDFVNQPIPRRVPHKIFCAVTHYHSRYRGYPLLIFFFFIMVLEFLSERERIMDYILLNFGVGNRVTVQGDMTSIWPSPRLWGIGPTSYSFSILFSTPEGYKRVTNYVWRRENIPGWRIILETLNNPDLSGTLLLTDPFPVTVEYIRGRPSAARALGTRFFSGVSNLILLTAKIYVLAFILFSDLRIAMRLLRKGLFTVGYISKQKNSSSPFTEFKRTLVYSFACSCDSDHIVNFTDWDGAEHEAFIVAPTGAKNRAWISTFANYGQPIGLLYLPGTNIVIITELLLNHYPKIDGPPNKEANPEYEKKQKNVTPKENDYVVENMWR